MIPEKIKVGGIIYSVEITDDVLVVDGHECKGEIDYEYQKIRVSRSVQGTQGMEQTFCHELVHAIRNDRNLDWGDKDELYTEELARGLYQVLKDNRIEF